MADVLQVSRKLWLLKMGMVNAYLLETEDGLALIDAGWPGKSQVLFKAVQASGHDPKKIRHLVLTHGHIDHAGSAADVLKQTGARSYAHPADLDLIENGNAEHPGTTITPGIMPAFAYLVFIKPGGTKYTPFRVTDSLDHGQFLPMAPGVEVIHTPGHSAGHCAFLIREEGLLIAGDICSNIMGLGYGVLNEDRKTARESILRAAEYPFERAVFGHGNPLDERANALMKEKFLNYPA
jgi:glyoxylase-like metal-dependent hydrolase (beta-lactamase superfamily II)